MELPEELAAYQAQLQRQGTDPAPLAAQAQALLRLPDSAFEPAVQTFHACADQSDYAWDSDYGTLLLESLADTCADRNRRRRLYQEAHARAGRFAGWATSGGEGLARSVDWKRIGGKLESTA